MTAPQTEETSDSLFDIALHNAVEGCVHETWAAYMAAERARRATAPELRETFATIAADEARHGQLAWDLHAFFMQRMDYPSRASVERAQQAALAELQSRARRQAQLMATGGEALGSLPPNLAPAAARAFAAAIGGGAEAASA